MQTLTKLHEVRQSYPSDIEHSVDTPNVEAIADQFIELDELSKGGASDQAVHEMQCTVEESVEELVRRPEESFGYEIEYLEELYAERSKRRELADGSTITRWGTRNLSKTHLHYRYFVLQRADGSVRKDVVHIHGEGKTAYRLDNDTLTVSYTPRKGGEYTLSSGTRTLRGEAYDKAVRDLFDASLVSAATAKTRSPEQQTKSHAFAESLLVDGEVDEVMATALSTQTIEHTLDGYHA